MHSDHFPAPPAVSSDAEFSGARNPIVALHNANVDAAIKYTFIYLFQCRGAPTMVGLTS